jgi:hypothetical protein
MSFDFKKYLQENKIGPYSKDLTSESGEVFEAPKPPAEDDIYQKSEPQDSEDEYDEYAQGFGDNPWIEELQQSSDGKRAGAWTAYFEHPGVIVWYHDDLKYSDSNQYLSVYATPHWDGDSGTPIDIAFETGEVMTPKEFGLDDLEQGDFPTFMDYAEAVYPYLEEVENAATSGEWAEYGFARKTNEAPTPPAEDDIYAKGNEEGDDWVPNEDPMWGDDEEFGPDAWINRIDGLGGDKLMEIVLDLTYDGFEIEDVIEFIKIKYDKYLKGGENISQ